MAFRCLGAAKALAIFTVLENIQEMDWRLAGLVRNTLRDHGLNQALDGNAGELFGIDMKDVGVLPIACATSSEFLWGDAGDLAEQIVE